METPGDIFAVLMAAGFSRRFGAQNKLLVPFRGKPLARYTLELACSLDCFSGIFCAAASDDVAVLAAGLPITLVRNAAPEKGQRESVRLGVQAAAVFLSAAGRAAENAYYLFLPCDQPLLDAATLRLMINARQKGRIVEPRFQGRSGAPSLFSGVFHDELLALGEGELPRIIKTRHREAIVPVEIQDPSVLLDIDTPEDLRRLELSSASGTG
ncbi:MAG: nucleotidyltransferase family protein [Treponema sp.]|jgi:molybdenum cofactor cytidylyltransferase|nr:nucleotidyltransferase family protein [Treponema sp.]